MYACAKHTLLEGKTITPDEGNENPRAHIPDTKKQRVENKNLKSNKGTIILVFSHEIA